ncbi:MAG: hypothetical protein ACJ76Z_04485 [Thermoleophilaceae bacterium]
MLALNLLAGAWGGVAWARHEPSIWFWYLLRAAQAAVVVQVTLGFVLLARHHHAGQSLHYVYGVSPLVVSFVTEGMRAGAAQRELEDVDDVDALTPDEQRAVARRVLLREMGVMTIGALLITTLALRAATTGG